MASVKEFWDKRAKDPTLNEAEVTHRDVWQRWLEITHLKQLLVPEERVLDIGCGTGYATKIFSDCVSEIVGIDYSEAMIERAKIEKPLPSNADFSVGDVLHIARESFGSFDTVISIRCLINLPDWTAQRAALFNIASVLEPGGRYIFVEGCAEGRANLNQLRQSARLPKMQTVWHNRDFNRADLLEFLSGIFEVEQELHFGTYDFISRVVHPLLVAPEPPKYTAKINEIAAHLALISQEYQDISRTLVLSLRKK